MGRNIRFSSDKFDNCIRSIQDISIRLEEYKEEWEMICRTCLDDLPEDAVCELSALRSRYTEIIDSLLFAAEKMRRISEVYSFWESRNCQLVESLPIDETGSSGESGRVSSPGSLLTGWNGTIRPGRRISRNLLMEDWLFSCVAKRILGQY